MNCEDKHKDDISKRNGTTAVYLTKIAEVYDVGNNQLFPGDTVVTMDGKEIKFGVVTNDAKHISTVYIQYGSINFDNIVIRKEKVLKSSSEYVHPNLRDAINCISNWEHCIATMQKNEIKVRENKFKQELQDKEFELSFLGISNVNRNYFNGDNSQLKQSSGRVFSTNSQDEMHRISSIADDNEMRIFWQYFEEIGGKNGRYFAFVYPLFGQEKVQNDSSGNTEDVRVSILKRLDSGENVSSLFEDFLEQPNKQNTCSALLSENLGHALCEKYGKQTIDIDIDFLETMDTEFQESYGTKLVDNWKKELILANIGTIDIKW